MTKRQITFRFPDDFEEACEFFGSPEDVEYACGFEFSCGEGLFMSDLLEKSRKAYSDAYALGGYEAARNSRADDETESTIERLDGEVDVNLIRIIKRDDSYQIVKKSEHSGKFKIVFNYDPEAQERGKECITSMRVVKRW
jgi:hypothetical protein